MSNISPQVNPYWVLYDADCGVCQRSVNLLRAMDAQGLTQTIPSVKAIEENLFPEVTLEMAMGQIQVITPEKKLIRGWVAVCTLATLFPQTKILGHIGLLPIIRNIGQIVYMCFAKNRQKISKLLFGEACKLPL